MNQICNKKEDILLGMKDKNRALYTDMKSIMDTSVSHVIPLVTIVELVRHGLKDLVSKNQNIVLVT